MRTYTKNCFLYNGKGTQTDSDKKHIFIFKIAPKETLADYVGRFKKFTGASYRKMGELLNVGYASLYLLIQCNRNPGFNTYLRICKTMRISLDDAQKLYRRTFTKTSFPKNTKKIKKCKI
jgi:hypothetical protein